MSNGHNNKKKRSVVNTKSQTTKAIDVNPHAMLFLILLRFMEAKREKLFPEHVTFVWGYAICLKDISIKTSHSEILLGNQSKTRIMSLSAMCNSMALLCCYSDYMKFHFVFFNSHAHAAPITSSFLFTSQAIAYYFSFETSHSSNWRQNQIHWLLNGTHPWMIIIRIVYDFEVRNVINWNTP